MKYEIPEERLLGLIDKYMEITYPNSVKVELAPEGGNVSITSLLKDLADAENGTADEHDVLIHKMDAYGMADIKINKEFASSVKSMFGGVKNVKGLLEKWFDNKPLDMDLLGSKKEEQNPIIKEYFNPIEYLQYLMDKETDSDFQSFQWMKAFQRYVNLIFKYTKSQTDMDNLSGMKVFSIQRKPWGTNFNDEKSKGMRIDWTLFLKPVLDGKVDQSEYKKMKEQYKIFKDVFSDTARQMGLTIIPAVEDKDVKESKIDFKFHEINPQEFENFNGIIEIKGEQNEGEITERCWKGYTQKGMKTMFGKRYPNCVKIKKG